MPALHVVRFRRNHSRAGDGAAEHRGVAAGHVRVGLALSAGRYPKAAAPFSAGSGDPRLMPSCRRPPLIRSVAAASSAMYSGFS